MLTDRAKKEILNNNKLLVAIGNTFRRSIFTVRKWVQRNDKMLETTIALKLIQKETGLSQDEILISEEVSK